MSFDTETLDLLISSFGWLLGMSCALVGGSITAYTLWYASSADRPNLFPILVRSAAGVFGIGVSTVGLVLLSIATEAFLRYPFGPSSGGTAWLGYFFGMHLLTANFFADHLLLKGYAARSGSELARAAAALMSATSIVCYWLTLVLGFVVVLVMLSMGMFALGWVE